MEEKFDNEFSEIYRQYFPKLVSFLSLSYRNCDIHLIEDIAEETMIKAWRTWEKKMPENPFSWLITVSRNNAFNILKRKKVEKKYIDSLAPFVNSNYLDDRLRQEIAESALLKDEQLRLMFRICRTDLSQEKKIILILRFICGLPVIEIAQLYMLEVEAMKKRISRLRKDLAVVYETDSIPHKPNDISIILEVGYSLFNQGYFSEKHYRIIREHLCYDALSFISFLNQNLSVKDRRIDALIALMCFSIARFPSRSDNAGHIVPLDKQDRLKWNTRMIEKGLQHLGLAFIGNETSRYHLEAAINACHSVAVSDDTTDWKMVLSLYNKLSEIDSSPVIRLNRAVAVFKVEGIEPALHEISLISGKENIEEYYLFHAIEAELLIHAKKWQQAISRLNKATNLSTNRELKKHFQKKVEKISRKKHS